MDIPSFDDRLGRLGLLAGGFVVLYGLAILVTMPWTTNESTGASIVQAVGILLTIAVGLLVIYVASTDDLSERLPVG